MSGDLHCFRCCSGCLMGHGGVDVVVAGGTRQHGQWGPVVRRQGVRDACDASVGVRDVCGHTFWWSNRMQLNDPYTLSLI